jgi:hypothetical protein
MNHEAPQLLVALEASGVGQVIRQSVWIYPTANVLHVVALAVFAAAVAVMDLRLIGAFSASPPADVVVPARRATKLALALLAASGVVLFIAEASHVALNRVFQVKFALIAAGILNALLVGHWLVPVLADDQHSRSLPVRIRAAAAISLAIWLAVATSGRLIAYI